jgi:hypothetical protein
VRSLQALARTAWRHGRPSLPTVVRALAQSTDSARRRWPQLAPNSGASAEYHRTCQQTFKESRALLARVRRGAYAVLVSSAVLAPILIASVSVASHHLHSPHRLWLLAIALAGFSCLALAWSALAAVRCLGLSGLGAPLQSLALSSQKIRGGKADLTRQGGLLLERAEGNRQRAEQAVGPLIIAQRTLAIAIVTLVLTGAAVLVAEAL